MKDQDQYISVIKFPTFVSISLIILSAIYFGFLSHALQKPGLTRTQTFIYSPLLVILLFLVATWVVTLMSTHLKIRPRWLQQLSKWMLVHVFYPLSKALAFITLSHKGVLIESFLNFNNETVLTDQQDIHNSNILVLLPHCLQKDDCTVRITTDIINCEECGGCDIATIKKLVETQKVDAAVATGGSLARKLIADKDPDVIVAVACHRDLVDGVRDAWSFPVYAILNERPKGPCHETRVSLASIEFAIKRFK
ncbi:MAG: DUF116 domain-containing protein [Candidatus Syntrophosphaera sp.]|nr:DUF116 domain-containing protein [Candidatus Syntrophosphaera sp.]